ncbi:DUF3164 family protein [Flammeovirga sp. SJP92]|uniref:DUF3164 family protein n=1 Tax=Flammeovirga sp. SJP92 TaxID=1775430 RepID=UPI0007889EEC|nr:DUF3164 family protein [Flammeovirga sp. SJP92]KXX70619.1 hypothetical protein AVL50_07295 [Flammeovirga sp. SJP92]
MTQEEEKLLEELQAKKQKEVSSKRMSYEALKQDLLEEWVAKFKAKQKELIALKTEAFKDITAFIDVMEEYGEVKKGQKNCSLIGSKHKIEFKMNLVKEYDERAELGAEKVRDWIRSEFSDEGQSGFIVDLLDKNNNGKFDYQKIQKIANHAQLNNDKVLMEAVELFNEAYTERYARFYFYVREKNKYGGYDNITLDFASLPVPEEVLEKGD